MTSADDTFRELRARLGSLRGFIAGAKMSTLDDVDSLLSVAQAEVEPRGGTEQTTRSAVPALSETAPPRDEYA